MPFLLIVIIAIAMVFDFLNGFHDSSNIVATMISSRALSSRVALGITAIAEFSGPFLFGVAVTATIGSEVVDPAAITSVVIIAALSSAILWNLFTWYFGWPSSTSHALIGGLIGVHLHDIVGLRDHLAPGVGQIDWDMVARYLPVEVVRTCECRSYNSPQELAAGVRLLAEKGCVRKTAARLAPGDVWTQEAEVWEP